MKLNLKNPLIFLDLETTGINVATDRIVEIALIKVQPDGSEETKEMRINPEMPIPEAASKVHGIYDQDVKDCPTFKEVAKSLAKFMEGCDLAGFNSNRFDIPLLAEEFLRVDVDVDFKKRKFVDVQAIFHKMEKRTLAAAYKFYCQQELQDAHSAMADTKATYEVLKSQLDMYQDTEFEDAKGKLSKPIQNDVNALCEFSSYDRNVDFMGRIVYNDKGVEVFNFGKNKGIPVEKVLREQPGYFGWMMQGEFPLYTKKVLTAIKLRMKDN
ncbi:3'-5' exonuclease [Mangrovibacterium marinum]|uniref:DNA polymerase-3 subunit epsilon n=1 Tax=Mangrovibacterium marinum TaxID=1639118 RepID=A0A2T5C4Z8_9BACT|nr:3'-5' exonuclease [Mangrovibacterium marinum]PTN09948.1 DNA polymerase-3 subunit epsilon [Mangrovibacterium marinum]